MQLLAASDATSRLALLEEHAGEVVDDCTAAIADVDHPRLREHRARLCEALAAYRADVPTAAQALAAVVLTALLQRVYGHEQLKSVRYSALRAKDSDERVLRTLKVSVLIEAAVPAVAGRRDRIPDDELPVGAGGERTRETRSVTCVRSECLTLPTSTLS